MKKTKFIPAFLLMFLAMPALAALYYNSSDTLLGNFNKVKCSTGVTCTQGTGNKLTIVSSPTLVAPLTLESAETLSNATDDTVVIASNDETTTFQVLGFEAKSAILQLWADEGDDAADKYSLTADTSDVLTLKNGTTAILAFSSTGVQTLADSETLANASDVVTIGFDDAAAELKLKAFEATDSSITLQADESDDNADDWKISSVATGNALTIANDTSGSQVAKLTMAASDGDITLTGGLLGDGGDTVSGFLQSQVTSTTTSLTIAQCGSTIINDSADVLTLPEASTALGCRYTFIVGHVSNFDVNPADGTDQIVLLTNAAGDAIRADAIGESVVLEAIAANAWAPVGAEKGTWTDVD